MIHAIRTENIAKPLMYKIERKRKNTAAIFFLIGQKLAPR